MPLPFIMRNSRTYSDVVRSLKDHLNYIENSNKENSKKYEKIIDEIGKDLAFIKSTLYGQDGQLPSQDLVAQLAQEIYNANVIQALIHHLGKFQFEARKDFASIFNNLLRRQIGTRLPTVEYLQGRTEILKELVVGYERSDVALFSGNMLRESVRHEQLAKMVLHYQEFYRFFDYVQYDVFDVASDAFSTFKDLLTKHKVVVAEFLDANYDQFFEKYVALLHSQNYVTRRQSLKLLGELMLERQNFTIMTRYISNPENLRLMMELLRDKSRNIQFEAFHVFKVFVANPTKPRAILDILMRNRERLVDFLQEFHSDRTDDDQFNDEKSYLIKQIQEMKKKRSLNMNKVFPTTNQRQIHPAEASKPSVF